MKHHAKLKANILYVDDDLQNLSSFKALFRREYNIFLAKSAQEGLEILENNEIQVLITDQRMPEMTGTQLLEVVAVQYPKTQRFLLTAYSDFNPLVEAINRGKLQGYFSKPIDDKLIKARIEDGLASYYLERENKKLMQTLRQNDYFLTAVMENIPDIIFVKDALTFKFVSINKAGEELLGVSREKIIGKHVKDFLAVTEAAHCHQTDEETLTTLDMINDPEEKITTWDEDIHYLNTKKIPILDSKGKPLFILGVSRDITEQRKQEERERQLQNQLIQAQKMEAIGTLAGGIAHDFNNILTLIIGYTELALNEISPDTTLGDNLKEVFMAGERGRDLVKQILTFSRQADEEVKPIQIKAIATEVLKFIRASIPKAIDIVQKFESDALIMGNHTQIHQVFMNLCTNAAYAMREKGGILEIQLTEVNIEENSIQRYQFLSPGKYLRITVSDNGIGISPDIIDAIFEPYFTTKQPGQGTGIGLAIVNGIIESHGGTISVNSELGEGTRFTIFLPIIEKRSEDKTRELEDLPNGSEKILFIDDEPGITKMNIRALERLGYQVTGCSNSLTALELFRLRFQEFDLVITDMAMPHMNGDRLAAEMIKIRPDIPIILCSGYLGKMSEKYVTHNEIKALLQKPIVFRELAKTIRKILDGK